MAIYKDHMTDLFGIGTVFSDKLTDEEFQYLAQDVLARPLSWQIYEDRDYEVWWHFHGPYEIHTKLSTRIPSTYNFFQAKGFDVEVLVAAYRYIRGV
jgi:hypothetical protein